MKHISLFLPNLAVLSFFAALGIGAVRADTDVNGKTTTLNYGVAPVPSTSLGALTMEQDSELLILGSSTTSEALTDTSTQVSNASGGFETIDLQGNGAALTLTLNSVGRGNGNIYNFVTSGGAVITSTLSFGAANYWALYDYNDWASTDSNGHIISGAASYNTTALNLSVWAGTQTTSYYSDSSTNTYSGTLNTNTTTLGERFSNSAGDTLTIGTGKVLTTIAFLDAQGTGAVSINGGQLSAYKGGTNEVLVIEQENTANTLTVNSQIMDADTSKPGVTTLTGPGTTNFTAANTYTGETYVTSGRLNNNGSITDTSTGTLIVDKGGTYGGTGTTVLGAGAGTVHTVTVNGTLSPGTGTTASLGTMKFTLSGTNASLAFTAGSSMTFDINGTNSDSVDFTGTAANLLSGSGLATLNINGTNISTSTDYVVFQNTTTTGFTFASMVAPTYYVPKLTYETAGTYAHDYVLTFTEIPEPKAWSMILIGCVALVGMTVRCARKSL